MSSPLTLAALPETTLAPLSTATSDAGVEQNTQAFGDIYRQHQQQLRESQAEPRHASLKKTSDKHSDPATEPTQAQALLPALRHKDIPTELDTEPEDALALPQLALNLLHEAKTVQAKVPKSNPIRPSASLDTAASKVQPSQAEAVDTGKLSGLANTLTPELKTLIATEPKRTGSQPILGAPASAAIQAKGAKSAGTAGSQFDLAKLATKPGTPPSAEHSLAASHSAQLNTASATPGNTAININLMPSLSSEQAIAAGNPVHTSSAIPVPLQHPQWPQHLGQQLISLSQSAQEGLSQTAELRLDPPELGPLRIQLHVQDGVTHALISSSHALVRQTLEQSLGQLQQQFTENGLSLGQANVSDHSNPQQFQQAMSDLFEQSGQRSGTDSDANHDQGTGLPTEDAPSSQTRPARLLNPNTLVDIYA